MILEAVPARRQDSRTCIRPSTRTSRHYAEALCIERPLGSASALEVLQSDGHPYSATVGLHVEPGPVDSGIRFQLDFDPRLVPLYIYKTAGHFTDAMTQYILHAFEKGLYGWQVTDCVVTMHECNYYIGDGPTKRVLPTPRTTAADFRMLTPLVLMEALRHAGTVVSASRWLAPA
jgi:ribosomal protection tetracycline resistance protein